MKTLVHEFPVSLAILNGTSFFLSLVQEDINMTADTIIGFAPEVAVKKHLIKIIRGGTVGPEWGTVILSTNLRYCPWRFVGIDLHTL